MKLKEGEICKLESLHMVSETHQFDGSRNLIEHSASLDCSLHLSIHVHACSINQATESHPIRNHWLAF